MRISAVFSKWSFLVLAAAGCAGGDGDDLASAEHEKRVKPNGDEGFLTGNVLVKVPANAPTLAPTKLAFMQGERQVAVGHIDTPVKDLPVGQYEIRATNGTFAPSAGLVVASVTVVGGQTKTLTLPVMSKVAVNDPPEPTAGAAPTFDFGPTFTSLSAAPRHLFVRPNLRVNGTLTNSPYLGSVTRDAIVLPASSNFLIMRDSAQAAQVDELASVNIGATPQIYTTPPTSNAWTSVSGMSVPKTQLTVKLEKSDFPPAFTPQLVWNCTPVSNAGGNYASPGGYGAKSFALASTVPAPAQSMSGTAPTSGCTYSVVASGMSTTLDTTSATSTIQVHFIDVEDVHVQHQDGTMRDVKGKVRLLYEPGPGQPARLLVSNIDTSRALPVVAGTYKVVVDYQDNNGPEVYTETVTVP